MAEQKKKNDPITDTIILASIIVLGTSATIYFSDPANRPIITNKKSLTGSKVYLSDGAKVYGNLTDALTENNSKTSLYDIEEERLILSTFYEYNDQYIRINNADKDHENSEKQIIENGGKAVCCLTTVDFTNYTPEGFYLIADVKKEENENTLSEVKLLTKIKH